MSSFERISSKDNDVIKIASKLISSAKFRREKQQFVLDGLRLCKDAALNGFPIDCLIVGDSAYSKLTADAEFLSKSAERSCIVPDHIISKISDTVNPQGFICICKMKKIDRFDINSDGLYIALENVADPSNLGAIARSAEAFNFNGILVSDRGCDPYSPKALRASMGALLRIPTVVVNDLLAFIKNTDLDTYASVVDKTAQSIRDVNFKKGSIAFIGNEANGLSKEVVNDCKYKTTIPMTGKAESLNAATAAAIIMWEMSCQK